MIRGARAVAVLLAVGCQQTVRPAADLGAAGAVRAARVVRVTSVSGTVVRQLADGTAVPLKEGDRLAADDVLATTEGSAHLDVGGVAQVEIAAQTQVAIGELTDTLSKVRLRDGRIAAVVQGGLQIDVPGANATATASDGEFAMMASGSSLSVATKSGQVTLSARGRSVRIGSGQLSIVERDLPPSEPQGVPASLLLKLDATRPVTQRDKKTTIRGSTAPGAVVSVSGVRLVADGKGEFSTVVSLKEGANTVVVESMDTMGRRQRTAWPRITVDTRAPETKTKVEW